MSDNNSIKVLMVSTEYPPMHGGVGRYTYNLVRELRKNGLIVKIICNERGNGDYFGLAPSNDKNYEMVLDTIQEFLPDIVHVQYEHGLYGLFLDPLNPSKTRTNIDPLYDKCTVPIVTTFHTSFTFKQWMNLVIPTKNYYKLGRISKIAHKLKKYYTHLINYNSFNKLNKTVLKKSSQGIVFSNYMRDMVGGGKVIYHGAEAVMPFPSSKREARARFALPENGRIALAVGFRTATKGWDIFKKMEVPSPWNIVINSSKNHYNLENFNLRFDGKKQLISLDMDFLNDTELSLLFHSADAVILPYKVSSGSGVMFDALAHNLPFVASNLGFFKEFSSLGLGLTVNRHPDSFTEALKKLESNYDFYLKNVNAFRAKLRWDFIAQNHMQIYGDVIKTSSQIRNETQKPSI